MLFVIFRYRNDVVALLIELFPAAAFAEFGNVPECLCPFIFGLAAVCILLPDAKFLCNFLEDLLVALGLAERLYAFHLTYDHSPVVTDLSMCCVSAADGPLAKIVTL